MKKVIDVLVDLTEHDVHDLQTVVIERKLPLTIKVPSEQDDTTVSITFIPAEEEKDEQ